MERIWSRPHVWRRKVASEWIFLIVFSQCTVFNVTALNKWVFFAFRQKHRCFFLTCNFNTFLFPDMNSMRYSWFTMLQYRICGWYLIYRSYSSLYCLCKCSLISLESCFPDVWALSYENTKSTQPSPTCSASLWSPPRSPVFKESCGYVPSVSVEPSTLSTRVLRPHPPACTTSRKLTSLWRPPTEAGGGWDFIKPAAKLPHEASCTSECGSWTFLAFNLFSVIVWKMYLNACLCQIKVHRFLITATRFAFYANMLIIGII